MTTQDPNTATAPESTAQTATAPAATKVTFQKFVYTEKLAGNFDVVFKGPTLFGKVIPILFVSRTRLVADAIRDKKDGKLKRHVAALYSLHLGPYAALGFVNPNSETIIVPEDETTDGTGAPATTRSPAAE